MCSIYTSFPETAEAMLYYQCTIIIATTTNHTIRTLSKSSSFMIHGIYFAGAHCLTHYNDKQEQYLRLQQIITSVLVIHINCSGPAKPDIASTWWAFYFMMSGYEWLKRLTILAIASYGSDQLIGSFLANIEPSVKSMYFLFGLLLSTNTDYSTAFALHSTSTFRQFFNIWNWDCKTTQTILYLHCVLPAPLQKWSLQCTDPDAEAGPHLMLPTWRRSDKRDVSSSRRASRKTFVCTSTVNHVDCINGTVPGAE